MKNFFRTAFIFFTLLCTHPIKAEVLPEDLKKWVPLIEQNHPEWSCPRSLSLDDSSRPRECNWVGNISFDINNEYCLFTITGTLYDSSSIPLPHLETLTPSDISVLKDSQEFNAFTIRRDSGVSIQLPKGYYEIKGRLSWDVIPRLIPVPKSFGVVSFTFDSTKKLHAVRTEAGIEFHDETLTAETDSANIQVYRTITDGNPFYIDTKIVLKISGKPRHIQLGAILPLESKTIRISSPLSVSLQENMVSAHVFQGDFEIDIESVLPQPVLKIELPKPTFSDWPKEEIWSWKPFTEYRLVEIQNAKDIHASQIELPPQWDAKNLMRVTSGTTIVFSEKRRGQEFSQRDKITIKRTFWPKIDQSGFTIFDTLSGTMHTNSRLNALPQLKLGSAKINAIDVPITNDPVEQDRRGIEIRTSEFSAETISEAPYDLSPSALGWDTTIENASITLMIPPSWKLIHVNNASATSGSWSSLWTVFDVFILIATSFFAAKIINRYVGIVYFAFMILARGEFLTPHVFFTYILIAIACVKVIGDHTQNKALIIIKKGASLTIYASCAAYLVQTLSFAKLQFIQLLFPQLQSGTRHRTITQELMGFLERNPLSWLCILISVMAIISLFTWMKSAQTKKQIFFRILASGFITLCAIPLFFTLNGIFNSSSLTPRSENSFLSENVENEGVSQESAHIAYNDIPLGSSLKTRKIAVPAPKEERTFQDRVLQSGPSLPAWHWKQAHIHFAGPITPDHQIRLFIISSTGERIICGIRVILSLVLLILVCSYLSQMIGIHISTCIHSKNTLQTTSGIFLALLLCTPFTALADYPPKEYIEMLTGLLSKNHCTEKNCSVVDFMNIKIHEKSFTIDLRAYSNGDSEVYMPGSIHTLIPEYVSLNGTQSSAIRTHNDFLAVKTSSGLNRIHMRGSLVKKDILDIRFFEKPLKLDIESTSWETTYKNTHSELPEHIRLMRILEKPNRDKEIPSSKNQTEEWFTIERELEISDSIRSHATVSRIGPVDTTREIRIPLQSHETILTPGITAENKEIVLQFPQGVTSLEFNSNLNTKDTLHLRAATTPNITEIWRYRCADYIHCTHEGISPISTYSENKNIFLFMPTAGEELHITPRPLESSPGSFLTVESVDHQIHWGEKMISGHLTFKVKATKQSTFNIAFKDTELEILDVTVDSVSDSRKFTNTADTILQTGSHTVETEYRIQTSPKVIEYTPEITISSNAGNITTVITPNTDRWIVWLGGSYWGPAVIFWAKVVVVFFILCIMQYVSLITISRAKTAILALALSFIPTMFQCIPLIWIYVLQIDKDSSMYSSKMYKLLLGTVAALSIMIFYYIIKVGLLYDPPTLIAGNGSTPYSLRWFNDFISVSQNAETLLPRPYVISFSLLAWRSITLCVSISILLYALDFIKKTITALKTD